MSYTTINNLDRTKYPYLNPKVGDDLIWTTDYQNVQCISSLARYDPYLGKMVFGGYRIDWLDAKKKIFSKQYTESQKELAFRYYRMKGRIFG
jgi:hypothetical protein